MNKKISFTILITALIISFLFLQFFFGKTEKTKFEEFALGVETSSFLYSYNSYPIHITVLDSLDKFFKGWKNRGGKDIILWLGNSQLHGINQFKPGDNTSPGYFYKNLGDNNYDLLAFSLPNANLQEHYLLFEYIRSILPIRELIIGVCFDDLRESGIRQVLSGITTKDFIAEILSNSQTGTNILQNISKEISENDDLAALDETVQEYTEKRLNNWLNQNFYLWNSRPEIRGQIFTQLFILRNNAFNIKPTSIRKMIKSRYNDNTLALEEIYSSAKESSIKIFTYILPIRSDVDIPYDISEYQNFKLFLDSLNNSTSNILFNFENIVPAEYWGTKDATTLGGEKEIDFMHFQAAGHKILADSLWSNISKHNNWK